MFSMVLPSMGRGATSPIREDVEVIRSVTLEMTLPTQQDSVPIKIWEIIICMMGILWTAINTHWFFHELKLADVVKIDFYWQSTDQPLIRALPEALSHRIKQCRGILEYQIVLRAQLQHDDEVPNASHNPVCNLSLIHIWRCRRSTLCRSRWSPYH